MLFVARYFDLLLLLLLQNALRSTLPYIPALEIRVHRGRHVLVLNYFVRSKRRGEWFKVLEDEFDIDELINSLVCLRPGFRNTFFNVKNC